MNFYVMCIDSYYVRDAQLFDITDINENELNNLNKNAVENEQFWKDLEPRPFVAVVKAENEDQAIEIASKKYRYDKRCLCVENIIKITGEIQ